MDSEVKHFGDQKYSLMRNSRKIPEKYSLTRNSKNFPEFKYFEL